MARMEETVEIRCLADKMFAYVLDARSWPQWHSAMLEAGQTSAGPMCIGIMFRGTNKVMGQRMDWTLMVTECVPDKKWGETISSGSILIE
jgi:Polyketide cyclase / dehydrase and lipid transport